MHDSHPENFVFFLGGHDAEMIEIRNILEKRGLHYHDHGLAWGAALSDYREELGSLPKDKLPVFIELNLDTAYPDRAMIIDHHGSQAGQHRKTSLEQVAGLLGLSLDRRQELISANDKGHIRAMLDMEATTEEIEDIRSMDRKAQGVTEAEERLARDSLEEGLEKLGEQAVLVHSQTNKTSPIVDRIWDQYRHIFVLTPDGQLNYFGTGHTVYRLVAESRRAQEKNPDFQYWYGGSLPDHGFWGASKAFATEVLKDMINEERILSQHIFMLPFTITTNTDKSDVFEQVDKALQSALKSRDQPLWRPATFEPESNSLKYSEYHYFHPFVRDEIFSQGDRGPGQSSGNLKDHGPLMRYYRCPVGDKARFRIRFQTTTYDLRIHCISLRIFETGIGILCLELHNTDIDQAKIEDVIRINDVGRRVYPQFLHQETGTSLPKGPKALFLASEIQVEFSGFSSRESFEPTYDFLKDHPVVADYVQKLLGSAFTTNPKKFRCEKDRYLLYQPTIDDRMYTVSWFGSDHWAKTLCQADKAGEFLYQRSELWNRFLFLDGGGSMCPNPALRRELNQRSTYARWVGNGCNTLYGITRYSLVCITELNIDFCYDVLRQHMRLHYAQMAVILLAQRASILKFSQEVSTISDRTRDTLQVRKIHDDVERLHAAYIRFVNRLWFTEITPQEQGIEMYHQAVAVMRLKSDMDDLQTEIKELFEYVSLKQSKSESQLIMTLTFLGAIFLPLTFVTGFFGMNLKFITDWWELRSYFVGLGSFLLIIVLMMYWMRNFIKSSEGGNSELLKFLNFRLICYFLGEKCRSILKCKRSRP